MSLLDSFLLEFVSNGLEQLNKDVDDASDSLDDFEESAQDAEDASENLNQNLLDTVDSFKQLAMQATKSLAPFLLLGKTISNAAQFASDALEVAEAAEKANMTLEQFQLKDGNKYVIFNKDDVKNAKEYEMIMRDIRSGTMSIGANISRMLLPAMIWLGKIVRQVVDFFTEHGEFIKAMFVGIATIITVACIPAIISMGSALLTALSPILAPIIGIISAITMISLLIEDLIVWVNGGESAFGEFYDQIFGGTEGAKKLFNDLKRIFGQLWSVAKTVLGWIAQFIGTVLYNALKSFVVLVDAVIQGFKTLGNVIKAPKSNGGAKADGSHADGLEYVPYDGYRAILHKGERVQTAEEANDWRAGLISAKKAISFTAQYPLNSIPQGSVSNAYNTSSTPLSVNISDITIQTQATDAQGIATDLASYIKQAVISLDDGMLA